MKVIVNGENTEVSEGTLLSMLIEELGIQLSRVAVERNRDIVPPEEYGSTRLVEGDRLEIVGFVGGG